MSTPNMPEQAAFPAIRIAVDTATEQRILALAKADGRTFTLWLLFYVAVWIGLERVVAVAEPVWIKLLSAFLLGSMLHTMTILQHDCGHASAYASPRLNLWVGRALAWFIIMPFTTFTELHRNHHAWLGDRKRDPDEWFYEAGTARLFLRECLFMPRFIWLSLSGSHCAPGMAQRVKMELLATLVSHAALAIWLIGMGRVDILLYGLVLPMLLLGGLFNPISRGFEHFPLSWKTDTDPDRYRLSQNTVTVTSPFIGFLWANINYHVEHHMYPQVPFYRLPRVHRLLRKHDYLRTRFLFGKLVNRATRSDSNGDGDASEVVTATFSARAQSTCVSPGYDC